MNTQLNKCFVGRVELVQGYNGFPTLDLWSSYFSIIGRQMMDGQVNDEGNFALRWIIMTRTSE